MKVRIFIFLILSVPASAVDLSNEALFRRCYSQITQTVVPANSSLLESVRSGAVTPSAACLQVFDTGLFTSDGKGSWKISNTSNSVAKAVVRTFEKLHYSFFENKDLVDTGGFAATQGAKDIFDMESPAFYYTKALFAPSTRLDSVLTSTKHLRALRLDTRAPASIGKGAVSGTLPATSIFGNNVTYAPIGELIGVEEPGTLPTAFSYTDASGNPRSGTVELGAHFGGGVLGSHTYLLINTNIGDNYRSDGGVKMLRRWSRSVMNDLLCRSLPAVRYRDVAGFKKSSSSIAFRKSQGCVQCHATMDRMAATIRGVVLNSNGLNSSIGQGTRFVTRFTDNGTAGTEWPTEPQSNYYMKKPEGVLFFRNAKGELVNTNVNGLQELGQAIAQQEDFYLCTAKRYYSYFMGVDVPIEDTENMGRLSATDAVHQSNVLQLARTLKTSQNLRGLVSDILNLREYKKSSFGTER